MTHVIDLSQLITVKAAIIPLMLQFTLRRVCPWRHLQQGAILRQRIQSVQHLNGHQHGQRHGGGNNLATLKVPAASKRQVNNTKQEKGGTTTVSGGHHRHASRQADSTKASEQQ